MNIRKNFREALDGLRHRFIEPGPCPGAPGVSDYDASIIVGEAAKRLYDDIEFYGPGADAAIARKEAGITRRDARILAKISAKATPPPPPVKKRRRRSKAERLQARAEKLRAEIEALKRKRGRE